MPYALTQRLESYSWPGNVRELQNAVARSIAVGEAFAAEKARPQAPGQDAVEDVLALDLPFPRARERMLVEFEKRYVARALVKHGGVVAHAAAGSGIARRYFNLIRARNRG
jgi:DNA-binding NtrC family response regulator